MSAPFIQTPRGFITTNRQNKAELVWDTARFSGGGPGSTNNGSWQGRFNNAQRFVDSEVLRLSEPYIPLLTGTLIKSGILGTEIGSGLVQWIAPYAKAQYYSPRKPGSLTGPLRGPFWFERMKEVSGQTILTGAKKIAGGG
jgi:Minor capsid protein